MSFDPAIWHIITSEFPPDTGGVSDHTFQIAAGLVAAGAEVHVWCPGTRERIELSGRLHVHRPGPGFGRSTLGVLERAIARSHSPHRILVQWVPHGFGFGSVNLPFCLWIRRLGKRGHPVDLMVHEPGLPFDRLSPLWIIRAALHRLMAVLLMSGATRIFVSAPEWGQRWSKLPGGGRKAIAWLPLPTGIPVTSTTTATDPLRRTDGKAAGAVVGYFGTVRPGVEAILVRWLLPLLQGRDDVTALFIGRGGEAMVETLISADAALARRLVATGVLPVNDVSACLLACDVLVQPFPDGVNARRSSVIASLAHGRAVITTRGVSTEPFWVESGAVELLDPDAPDAAGSIERFLNDADARRALGDRARSLYRSTFSLDHSIEVLTAVLPSRGGPVAASDRRCGTS